MSNKLDLPKKPIGRRALVTGCLRGIDAAIAQRLPDAWFRGESSHHLHATKGAGHESA